jgi:RNA polymerase sigma-70 factor (ECF subfamily)
MISAISSAPTAGAERSVELSALQQAILELPETLRDVLVLKLVEGYSHEEIASLLSISAGASEVRLVRALKRLRQLLREPS